jgi:hypothetical protein
VRRLALVPTLGLAASLFAPPARACGVGAPGAPAGVCDASEVLDAKVAAARRDRFGVSYGHTDTVLFFGDGRRAEATRNAAVLVWEHRLAPRWTLQIGLGSLLGGSVTQTTPGGVPSTFQPGVLGSVGLTHRIFEAEGGAVDGRPFLLATYTLSFALTTTKSASAAAEQPTAYSAFDLRLGLILGTTVAKVFTPYLAARVFGGPIFWTYAGSSVVGTDAYKYELGGGLAVSVVKGRLALFVDGSVLGERDVRGGASLSF